MNNEFSFRYLKTRVSISQILAAYGLDIKLKQQKNQLRGPCPLHHGDNPTAFCVHLERGVWNCFTGCGGGDIVELIRCIERCSYAEAARHLHRLAGHSKPSLPVTKHYSTSFKSAFNPFKYRIPLNPVSPFLQNVKKLSSSTAICFEAGVSDRSTFLKGMVAVRLHDLNGQPLGYCGRRLDPDEITRWGKWRFPRNFPKGEVLYNAHRARPLRNQGIIIVECPWAAMRLAQSGIKNGVSILGTSITQIQTSWLSKAPAVLLMLDGDNPGRKAASAIAEALRPITKVFIHELADGKEPEDMTDNELSSIVHNFLPMK